MNVGRGIRTTCRLLVCTSLIVGMSVAAWTSVAAAAEVHSNRIDLRVLVLSDGSSNVVAIQDQLTREGVPTTVVNLGEAGRPVIDASFLADAATREAFYQGVVLAGPSALAATELTALTQFERSYGVREVDAFVYPNAAVGMNTPAFSGTLDGAAMTVLAAGRANGFGYLAGPLTVDDVDPAVSEVYGYLATAASPPATGESFTPLITADVGGVAGSVVGVHTVNGHSQMVITAAFDAQQRYFMEIGHGIITWLTRGLHLGIQRNYLSVHVDDVLAADSQWSPTGQCTPGEDCFGDKAGITTPDIRMQPADVTNLVNWQASHGMRLDMVFNGAGSDDVIAGGGGQTDPLLTAFQANSGAFHWINHTYSHENLGCIQVAPLVAGEQWHCATTADEADPTTVYIDPAQQLGAELDSGSGLYFLNAAGITAQIGDNLTWAAAHGIPVDPAEVVTGEHSGLALLPQQPIDNPNLGGVLTADAIRAVAADASRESASRLVGSARTVPRHPMNIFYNVSSIAGEVSEYNWFYTSAASGGSGLCEAQPQVTTCIAPLADATVAEAAASFEQYILPSETRNALSFVLSNDPRPFFVHQSNLTGDRILLPLLESILSAYGSVYDVTSTPLVHLTMTEQALQLQRMGDWAAQAPAAATYLDATGVHVPAGSPASVPLTVPAGSAVTGAALSAYAGELSGWVDAAQTASLAVQPPTPLGGYIGVPDPPVIGTATAGNASATVTWAPAVDRGSPVTGYRVLAYLAANVTPTLTLDAPADATRATVTGLLNYSSYTFRMVATSAVGDSGESAPSNAVIPGPSVPDAPGAPAATAGDGSATVTWQAPADGGSPITVYTVRAYVGGATAATTAQDVTPPASSAAFTGLTNGVAYTFDVFAYNAAGPGPASPLSAPVTPGAPPTTTPPPTTPPPTTTATVPPAPVGPGAPTLGSVTAGQKSVTVTWLASTATGVTATVSFRVQAYTAGATTPVSTVTVKPSVRSAVVTGMKAGTPYTFAVVAVDAAGRTASSARSAPVTPYDKPGKPPRPTALNVNQAALVMWTQPLASGAPITSYQVTLYAAGTGTVLHSATVRGTETSTAVGGLGSGTALEACVVAVNRAGRSAPSNRSATVRMGPVPRRPVIGTAESGKAGGPVTATVRWTQPTSRPGPRIIGYRVTAHGWSGARRSTIISEHLGPARRVYVTTLPPGRYTFTVQSVGIWGRSGASTASNVVIAR